MTRFDDAGRGLARRLQARLRRRSARMGLRRRLDAGLLLLAAGLGGAFLLAGFAIVAGAEVWGLLTPPGLRPLSDERILANVRQGLDERPHTSARWDPSRQRLFVAQAGGEIHRYDPDTRLWDSETPFEEDPSLSGLFTWLQAGCGAPETSLRSEGCPDPDSLWALTAGKGLARSKGPSALRLFDPSTLGLSAWQTVVGDNAFLGASGDPVSQDTLTAAAVSPDGRVLALGSLDGLGLYDHATRSWIPTEELHSGLPSSEIGHLAFWRGSLWAGTPRGAAEIIGLSRARRRTSGKVIQLRADPEGGLWVMEERSCIGQSQGCLWLGRFDDPSGSPTELIDENSRFPELSLDALHFAQQQDELLLLAGRAGMYSYDTRLHRYRGLFPRPVTAVLPFPGGTGFYFGGAGVVGVQQAGDISSWPLPADAEVKRLRLGRGSQVLALTGDGRLYSFDGADEPRLLLPGGRSKLPPDSLSEGVALLDSVLLEGPAGALLHDMRTRSYTDLPADTLPGWLRRGGRRWFASDRYLYVLSPESEDRTLAYTVPLHMLKEGEIDPYLRPYRLRAPVRAAVDWDGRGLGVIDARGDALRLHPSGAEPLNAEPLTGLAGLPLLDAAAEGGQLTLATSAGLAAYNTDDRAWNGFAQSPLDAPAAELAYYNRQLLVRTSDGRVGRTTSSPQVIGDGQGFSISDAGLSDVHSQGRLLYLAGDGAVELYDPLLRRIAARWRAAPDGAVDVIETYQGRPLAQASGMLLLGEQELATGPGRVVQASAGEESAWAVVEQGGARHLRVLSTAVESRRPDCFFRKPTAGVGASRLFDAARLSGGAVAVVTDAGLRIYQPRTRSWVDPPGELAGLSPSRVVRLGGHLLVWREDPQGATGRLLSADSLLLPESCLDAPARLRSGPPVRRIGARSLAYDPESARAAWLNADGSLYEFADGETRLVLAATGEEPPWDALRQVFDRRAAAIPYLLFSDGSGLWRYRLDRRDWLRIRLRGMGGDAVEHINAERDGHNEYVTVKSRSGAIYFGSFDGLDIGGGERPAELPLRLIHAPRSSPMAGRIGELLDVEGGSGPLWTFVLPEGHLRYDASRRTWLNRTPAQPDPNWLPGPPLDAGWLRWDRSGRRFLARTPAGEIPLSPAQAMLEGRLFFEALDAVLVSSGESAYSANSSGVWAHSGPLLALDDPAAVYRPLSLGGGIRADHGLLRGSVAAYDVSRSELKPPDQELPDIRIGGTVIRRGGQELRVPPFPWDRGRSDVTYRDGALWLQSEAGALPARSLAPMRPSLPDKPRPPAILVSDERWTWRRTPDGLRIELSGGSLLDHGPTQQGYAFKRDLVEGALLHEGRLFILCGDSLQIAASPRLDLPGFTAESLSLDPASSGSGRRLESLMPAGGQASLLLVEKDGGQVLRWEQGRFIPVSNPASVQEVMLAESSRLRFQRRGDGIVKSFRVEDASGREAWVPFRFEGGRFPFDVITSMAVRDGTLVMGSLLGLQVYTRYADAGLEGIDSVLSLGPRPGGDMKVDKVGRSAADPSLLMARSATGCLQQRARGAFQPCPDASLLDRRLRAEMPLWRWIEQPDGSVRGRYRTSSGWSPLIEIRAGRFPHDRLRGLAALGRNSFFLWRNGWVSVHPEGAGRLEGMRVFNQWQAQVRGFLRRGERLFLRIGAGLLEWRDDSWSRVPPDSESEILDWAADPPIYESERLRVVRSAEGIRFQHRPARSSAWVPLRWSEGRLEIDAWNDFLLEQDRLWAATPAGLAAFQATRESVYLDPDRLRVLRGPLDEEGRVMAPTDLRAGAPALLLRAEADSGKLFRVRLDAPSPGRFVPLEADDPFAEQTLVATDYWEWKRTNRSGGSPGVLRAALRGEDVRISSGRFAFDTLTSLALFRAGRVELATAAAGWFQAPRTSLSLNSLGRAREPGLDARLIANIHPGRSNGDPALCLSEADGDLLRLAKDGAASPVAACPEFQGQSSLWSWSRSPEGLQASARRSVGGPALRRLEEGRFTDNVLNGPPLTLPPREGEEGPRYLLPTAAGVLELDAQLRSASIHPPPFPGLDEEAAPRILALLPESGRAAYLGGDAFHELSASRPRLAGFSPGLPPGAVLVSLTPGPGNLWRLDWRRQATPHWTYLTHDFQPLGADVIPISLQALPAYRRRQIESATAGVPYLLAVLQPSRLELRSPAGGILKTYPLPEAFHPHTAEASPTHIYLIAPDELLEVNLRSLR